MEGFSDGGSTPPASTKREPDEPEGFAWTLHYSTKKDGGPVRDGRLFLCGEESKPERGFAVKKNNPGDCFLGEWCAGGYRNAKRLGRRALQLRSGCLPPPPPFILTSGEKLQKSG